MRSSYVDIRRGTLVIVGRVVWSCGRRFGIRTQDRIRAADLVNEPVMRQRPLVERSSAERRGPSRMDTDARIAKRLDRSRRFASLFQTSCVVFVGGCIAMFLAIEMYHALASPFARVIGALGGAAG